MRRSLSVHNGTGGSWDVLFLLERSALLDRAHGLLQSNFNARLFDTSARLSLTILAASRREIYPLRRTLLPLTEHRNNR
jgi:hypothetical protein